MMYTARENACCLYTGRDSYVNLCLLPASWCSGVRRSRYLVFSLWSHVPYDLACVRISSME